MNYNQNLDQNVSFQNFYDTMCNFSVQNQLGILNILIYLIT